MRAEMSPVATRLVSLLALIGSLSRAIRSETVVVSASQTLESFLCGNGLQREEGTELNLLLPSNVTHYIGSGDFCVVQNLSSVVISSDTPGKRAEIVCNHTSEFSFFTTRGFAFLNSNNLTLRDLSFSQCGGVLSREALVYENTTEVPVYFGTHQSAVLFFSETLDLTLYNIAVTEYYGFAIIAANLYGSPLFHSLQILNSLGATLCPSLITNHTRGNYTCYGSGVLVYIHDSKKGNSTTPRTHKLIIAKSLFKNNSYWTNDYECMHNVFQFNPDRVPIVGAGGLTVYFTQSVYRYLTRIDDCEITENTGTVAGGIFTAYVNSPPNSSLQVTNTVFSMNSNLLPICPGTAFSMYIYYTETYIKSFISSHQNELLDWIPLSIFDTLITKHTPRNKSIIESSSAVYLILVNQPLFDVVVKLSRVNFTHNGAFSTGICMYAQTSYGLMNNGKPLSLVMIDVVVEQNFQYFGQDAVGVMTNSSQFVFTGLDEVRIVGTSQLGSSFVANNGTVLQAYASDIYLTGKILFKDNMASQGAAIGLKSNSHLIIAENSTILFQNNHVFLDGGAIYANEVGTENSFCVIQVDSKKRNLTELNINVTFDGNTALRSGPATYVGPLQLCFQTRIPVFPRYLDNLYNSIFTFSGNETRALASPAVGICPCVNNVSNCKMEFPTRSVYPGDSITVSLIAIDSTGGTVFSQLNSSFSRTDSTIMPLPDWWINADQEITTLYNEECRTLTYTIHCSIPTKTTGRLNFAVPSLPPLAYQNISLKTCPPGFVLNQSKGECVCNEFLSRMQIECDRKSKVLKQSKSQTMSWIGVIKNGSSVEDCYIGYAPFCPPTYCKLSAALDPTLENSSVCFNARTGVLCGNCQPGYSISLGPHMCLECSNYWLFTIVVYLGGGIIAVLIMSALNLTLHMGTIGGIIFYANLSRVSHVIKLETWLIVFMEPFSIFNLDQSFPSCLYDGMTMTAKLGLQLAYSIYLWIIVAVVLLVAHCSSRATRILQSPVQVLVTLVHLSFSRMLITVIEIVSSGTVITGHNEYSVWLADGSVQFGQSYEHIILLCAASLIVVLVVIPYLVIGTLGSFGLRYRWVNKLRPFIDAIHGPYKDNRRYWFGMRLVLLVIIYLTYAILRGRYPQEQQLMTVVFLVTFTIIQATIAPFENDFIGFLDTWVMFNAIMLICINLYSILGGENAEYLLLINLIVMLCTVVAVVVYHVVLVVQRVRKKPILNNATHTTVAIHTSTTPNYQSTGHTTPMDESCQLRESLLDQTY